MHRLSFSKVGAAKYISHLDLMRTFQRAFLRAGLSIRHTEGFHPHAFVSIPLPLPVGFSSECEVLECEILGDVNLADVPARMNAALPAGIAVRRCYEAEQKAKDLSWVHYIITMEYENGAPFGAETAIRALFARESLVVSKRSKKARGGQVEVDLIPLIHRLTVEERRDVIILDTVIRAQNPGMNPELMLSAIRAECPDAASDHTSFHRREVRNAAMEPWE